jgi:hypothetical protein
MLLVIYIYKQNLWRISSYFSFCQYTPLSCKSCTVNMNYSSVSFCDGSFYDDSLLQLLSSRTEHSRLVVHYCRNSSVLSLFSALQALFRCACVSYFSVLVQFFWVDCDFSTHDVQQKRQKRRKNRNTWRYIISWYLLNHSLGLLQKNKKLFDWYFVQLSL